MSRFIVRSSVLTLFSLVLIGMGTSASAQVISFNPTESGTLACGETFTVDVNVSSEITGLRAFTVAITYDGDRIAPVFGGSSYSSKGSLITGAGCGSLLFDSIIDGGGGADTLKVDVALLGCDVNGAGTILTVEFEAAATGVPTFVTGFALNLGATSLRDAANDPIFFTLGAGGTLISECNHAPDAVDDSGAGFNTDEDTPFTTGNVLSNDSEPDNADTVILTGFDASTTLGSVTDLFDGTFNYSPPLDYNGTDTFEYFVTDGALDDTATVTINVNAVNDPPAAQDDNVSTGEDTTLVINVLADNGNGVDYDVDDAIDPATAVSVPGSGPANGSIINNTDGTFDYIPALNFNGADSFDYTVNDVTGDTSNVATVSINVISVNDPPIAMDDSVTTPEDTPIKVDIYADNGNGPDVDVDGTINPNTMAVVDNAVNGFASVDIFTGKIDYASEFNYTGPDSFTYNVRDYQGALSNTATVYMTVGSVNDVPEVTNPGNQSNTEIEEVTLQIVATDIDEDVLQYIATGLPSSLGIDLNSGLVSGQIDCGAAVGSPYSVTVGVDDGTDTTWVSFDWTVGPPSRPPITGLTATQRTTGNDTDGTTEIELTWSRPLVPGETADIYRKGFGDYPEYDDGSGSAPTAPATVAAALGDGWVLLASVSDSTYVDEPTVRDFYHYVIFAVSACSESSPSSMTAGTLNYHLGDFTDGTALPNPGDNALDVNDIALLGDQYGNPVTAGNNVLDVGPTSGGFVDSRPTTDNVIGFEDLVLFSINFGAVSSPGVRDTGIPTRNALAYSVPGIPEIGEEFQVDLKLEANGDLKALSVSLDWDREAVEYVGYAAGQFMGSQQGYPVLLSPSPGTLDVTTFGSSLTGDGILASVTFRVKGFGEPNIDAKDVKARDAANRPVMITVEETRTHGPIPAVTRLLPSAPNPFLAGTTISFDLAQEEAVRIEVYGVDGRRVRILADEHFAPGAYQIPWDGRDDVGRGVASGIYLIRFQAGQKSASNRVVRLK